MRLRGREVHAIREVFTRELGPLVPRRPWLLGPRTKPAARGGDINLDVAIDTGVDNPPALVRRLRRGLEDRRAERRADSVIRQRGSAPSALRVLACLEHSRPRAG